MKRKLFFITFLMLFCSSMFGQHWTMTEADIVKYTFNTTVNAAIKIQGQTPENIEELEIAAFHNGVLRGVASPVVETLTGQYVTYLVVYSSNIGELITFKLYDPSIDKEYDTDYTINFTQTEIGEPIDPVIINFYTKHWNYVYNPEENYMALPCIIKVDGNLIDKSNYEIAAFSGNQLRGVANPELEPVINIYKAMLKIDGTNGEKISFRLFDVDAQKELETDYTIPYDFDYFAGDVEIEFKNNPVARIGEEGNAARYFSSLEAAVAAAVDGETIVLLQDVNLTETLTIEKSITIDLNEKKVTGADGDIVFDVKTATTIENGTVIGNKSGTSSGLIEIYANLDLDGVTIETSKINALRFKAGECTATLTNCNVTGAFKGYGSSVWEIMSGVYKASSTSINEQLNGSASVSGGTFHYEIKETVCAPGYVVMNNGDGTWTVKYAPAAFVDADNDGILDEGEVVYGNLDQIFANHKEGDVHVVLTADIVANTQVDTDADAHYYFTTNVEEGVTMDFLFAEDWNYIQKMTLGKKITLNADYLLAWTEFNVSGTINTDYLYTTGAETTITETGVVNAKTGDATVQVKNGAEFTVNGTLNTSTLNVWVGESKLVVSGANAKVDASWVDIWDGTPSVTVQNGATLVTSEDNGIKASRGGSITVNNATLTGKIELGHNGESAGELTVTGNSTLSPITLTVVGSTVEGPEGLNVTTNVPDHKVVYENGVYKVVAKVYVAQVGDVKYESVNEAINSADDGATVQLLPGTIEEYVYPWPESNHSKEKSITIIGAENFGTTLTGGMYLGYDDSQCREHNIVVRGINFTGKGILVACQKNVVIENNKFSNITYCVAVSGSANENAISVTGKNINATVTGNVIDGTASAGINLRDTKTVNVSGNTVTNTVHNSITIQNNTTDTGDNVVIENNTLSNWGTGGEGRAVRIAGGAEVNVNKNVMSHTSAPEEFVKVTGTTTIDASANYWNGVSPLTNGMFTGVEGDLVPVLVSYYTDVEKTNLVTLAPSVAKIGEKYYQSLAAAFAAAAQTEELTTIELLPVTIEEGTVELPATLKNVTVKGAEGAVLKDMTIMAHDGNSINYEGITFDGVVFDNSRISVTGWRNNGVVVKDFTVTNCRFFNLNDETNVAPVHFNMAATEPVNGFTFTNNVIDGATGGSKSGVYAQMTGKVIFTNNTINNVAFRPYVIQLTTDDGIADEFTVTVNTFSGSAAGRAQALTNNAEGTDEVELTVSNNIFKGITAAQQICYWNFNEATTTATLEKNYYDIDVMANPDRIYYNSPAQNISDLSEMGIFPIYTELKEDGTINEESLFDPVAYVGTVAYETLAEAFACQGGTIVLLKNIELTQGLTVAAGKTFTLDLNGKVVSGVSNTAATSAVITNNGNLTVKTSVEGGKITSKANNPDQNSIPAYANNTITNCGVLTLLSGTIENSTEQGLACFPIDNNSTVRDAVLNINGGTVTGRGAIRQFANSNTNKNEVNVTAGTVTGTSYAIWVQNPGSGDPKASLNIEGGELSKILMDPNANFEGSITGGTITEVAIWEPDATNPGRNPSGFITGGTFGMDVTEFCAFNYVCTSKGDGTYGIEYKPQEEDAFVIETLHELEAFRDAVNAGNNFYGKVFKLKSNIDLNPTRAINNWEPIGTQANPFKGTFDGGDNTISNLVVEGENNVGLFGYADNATIKNVKLENVNVKGTNCVGAIAGQVYSTSLIDNCHVSGLIQVEGQTNVGGIVGKYYTKVTNSSVIGDGMATSYVKGVHYAADYEGDNIGGIMGHGGENNTFTNNTVKNITISGTRKVGGIVGVTDQNTDVTNCLVENVNIETTATAQYATDNAAKAGHASIVGSYTKLGANNNGTVTNCVVKNVTFVNNDNVTMSAGPITGGAREGMVDPTGVTASGNLIYMSTITGNTTNMYLMNAVAKIGTTEYYTLFDAVAAVQDGETKTITMLRNTAEEFAIDNTTANITLDMATYTLTGAITPSKANLTIENGTINNENASYSAIEINAGTLVLNDVNVTSKRHGVRIDGAVEATINGGEYRLSATSGTRHAVNVSGAANVTIKAGTFVGPKGTTMDSGSAVCVQSGATVTIEGGDFSGGKNATLGVSGEMIVKGGTFDQDPSAYLADAYTVNIENEMYVVRYTPIMVTYPIGNPVYPEGKVEYYSDMLEAVPYTTNCPRLEGAIITLLADVSGAGMRFMENDMVFDLNGHTYTITAGTGSQGTNTSGFQIRPEVTTNVLFKDGTIKVAEGAPVVWMFNCYATDFIVEDVTVDCSNMAYSYGESCYVVVSREGDNVQLTGETKIVNFNSDVAGNAINVGGTMTIGEEVYLGANAVIVLGGGAQLTAPANLNVVTVDGYMVVYENGVYKSVKVVAQVGENKFGSVIAALNYAIANNAAQVKIVSDSRELMPTDVYLRLNADLEITAAHPYTVKFYNNGTNYDFVVDSENNNTLTFDENVTFQLEDRIIWLGYDGNNVDVVVNGTLAAYQIWHGADTKVTSTGTIKSTGEAFVMRRGATLTVDGGTVNASYFNILAGNIDAENANITCGAMWIANTGNYIYEGNVNINIKSSTLTSNGNLKSSTAHADGASINFENSEVTFVLFDGYGVSDIDANTKLNVKGTNAAVSIKGLTNNGLVNVTETAKLTLTGTVTNNGAMKLDATSVIYAPENLGVTIDDNDYDVVYENGAYRAVHKPFVAEVDGTQYTSLQAAIDAADGKTVVVLDNITLTETVTVAAGTTVTLDLNGKTVSAETTFAVKAIVNNGTLTINGNGGTIDISASTTESIQVVDNYGTLTINGGTYKGATSNYSYAIRANDANSVTNIVDATITTHFGAIGINKGVTTITDGKFEVTSQAGGHALYVANAEVTINGGEFIPYANGYSYAVLTNDANAKVSITGGTFKKGLGDPCVKALSGNIIITGGTFATNVNPYCHQYYAAIQGDDNLWRVEQVLFAQTTALQGGWNWYSSYVDLSTPNGLEKIQTALGTNGEQIKTQGNQFSFYQNNQWISSPGFTSLYNDKMYMIKTTSDVSAEIIGSTIDYANTVIVLNKGWNWISYPLSVSTDVNEALEGMSPADGDIIKGYDDNSTSVYYLSDDPQTPSVWWPAITLEPGQGYMYKSNTNSSFIYKAGDGTSAKASSRDDNYWVSAKSQYANNMTMIAMLSVDNEIVKGDYEIAAFANGECRGSARPIYNEHLDAYVLLLTVYGDEVEELTFKYYDVNYETEYELSNRINYSNDAVVGSIDEPYMFNLDILNIGETSVENISIYPNPTTTGSEINLQAVCDKVEVFNALGVKVAEYTNVDSIDAIETAGVYVIRLTIDNSARNCRLIVK